MRLIVEYHWDVPYSASGTEIMGVEYESVDKFNFDLELLIESVFRDPKRSALDNGTLVFAGMEFEFDQLHFEYRHENHINMPNVYTLDEWFEMQLRERKRVSEKYE